MVSPQNVFLVGPMGVGKTTIGRILANKLHLQFVDLDSEIEKSCGADIAWIFDVEGEEGFRRRESQLLEQFSSRTGQVLATGGGAILSADNRRLLVGRGTVVYLKATAEQLYKRTKHDKKRPLLQVDNVKQVILDLLNKRDPLYTEVADIVLLTGDGTPQSVADVLYKQINELPHI